MLSDYSPLGDWMSTLSHNKLLYNSKSLFFLFGSYSSNAKKIKWKNSHLLPLYWVKKRSLKRAELSHECATCIIFSLFTIHAWKWSMYVAAFASSLSAQLKLQSNDIMGHNSDDDKNVSLKTFSRHAQFSHIRSLDFTKTSYEMCET